MYGEPELGSTPPPQLAFMCLALLGLPLAIVAGAKLGLKMYDSDKPRR